MGAKYLKEVDVNTREECLKFCCDTESCDVFIFEEKVYIFFSHRILINEIKRLLRSFVHNFRHL